MAKRKNAMHKVPTFLPFKVYEGVKDMVETGQTPSMSEFIRIATEEKLKQYRK